MNKKQEEALRELEKAMKACSKLGIVFCGIENKLWAASRSKYTEAKAKLNLSPCELFYHIKSVIVEDNSSYLDSGAG